MNSKEATKLINIKSYRVPEADRARFIEATETEILALHDGNFARYRISPKEFTMWKSVW